MPSNHLTVSKNGGAPSTGAISCTWEDVIRLRLNNSVVRSARYEIFGYPPGWSAPVGWTFVSESRLYYSTEIEPADITLPTEASNRWGKWLTRLYVNEQLVDESTALEIVSPNGLHALPAGEGSQFGGAAQQWVAHLEANLRVLEDGLAGGGGGGGGSPSGDAGGDLGGTYPNPTIAKIQDTVVDFDGDVLPANVILITEEVSGQVRIRALPSPANGIDAHLLVSESQDPREPPIWRPYFPGEFAAQKFLGTSGTGLLFGSGAVSIAGAAGTQALTNTNLTTHVVRLTGAITGNRTITIPAGNGGRAHMFVNQTTGLYTVRLEGPSGGFCYLLPGQSREVWVDDAGILRGEALYLCETEITVSLIGLSGGVTTQGIVRLPGGFSLERCERYIVTAPDGDADHYDSVGFTASLYEDIIYNSSLASVRGLGAADWGSGFSDGYSYNASERTLTYLIDAQNQTVANTAGAVRIRVAGRHFGT